MLKKWLICILFIYFASLVNARTEEPPGDDVDGSKINIFSMEDEEVSYVDSPASYFVKDEEPEPDQDTTISKPPMQPQHFTFESRPKSPTKQLKTTSDPSDNKETIAYDSFEGPKFTKPGKINIKEIHQLFSGSELKSSRGSKRALTEFPAEKDRFFTSSWCQILEEVNKKKEKKKTAKDLPLIFGDKSQFQSPKYKSMPFSSLLFSSKTPASRPLSSSSKDKESTSSIELDLKSERGDTSRHPCLYSAKREKRDRSLQEMVDGLSDSLPFECQPTYSRTFLPGPYEDTVVYRRFGAQHDGHEIDLPILDRLVQMKHFKDLIYVYPPPEGIESLSSSSSSLSKSTKPFSSNSEEIVAATETEYIEDSEDPEKEKKTLKVTIPTDDTIPVWQDLTFNPFVEYRLYRSQLLTHPNILPLLGRDFSRIDKAIEKEFKKSSSLPGSRNIYYTSPDLIFPYVTTHVDEYIRSYLISYSYNSMSTSTSSKSKSKEKSRAHTRKPYDKRKWDDIREMIYGALQALKHLKNQKIIHRQISPTTIRYIFLKMRKNGSKSKMGEKEGDRPEMDVVESKNFDLVPHVYLSDFNEAICLTDRPEIEMKSLSADIGILGYQAPEILLAAIIGAQSDKTKEGSIPVGDQSVTTASVEYSYPVDIWSLGMVFLKMITLVSPLEKRSLTNPRAIYESILSEFKTVKAISSSMDKFNMKDLPSALLGTKNNIKPGRFKKIYKAAFHLLSQMLILSPESRITPEQALEHPFFKS